MEQEICVQERCAAFAEKLSSFRKEGDEFVSRLRSLLKITENAFFWADKDLEFEWKESGYRSEYFAAKEIRKASKTLCAAAQTLLNEAGDSGENDVCKISIAAQTHAFVIGLYSSGKEKEGHKAYSEYEKLVRLLSETRKFRSIGSAVRSYYTKELSGINSVADDLLKEGHSENAVRRGLSLLYINSFNS